MKVTRWTDLDRHKKFMCPECMQLQTRITQVEFMLALLALFYFVLVSVMQVAEYSSEFQEVHFWIKNICQCWGG